MAGTIAHQAVLAPPSGPPPPNFAASPTQGDGSPSASSIQHRYTLMRTVCLGEGSFGRVYKAIDNVTGAYVAVKEALCAKASAAKQLADELGWMRNLDHENIVRLLDGEARGATALVVMELLPGGSLQSVLDKVNFRLHENVVRRYFKSALSGLAYLHSRNIVHRDIKPGNMLLSADGVVKLSDFGISKQISGSSVTATGSLAAGTPCFMAPEVIRSNKMTFAGDIWAVACSIVQLGSHVLPWSHAGADITENVYSLVFHIGSVQPPDHHPLIPEQFSPALRDIIAACFAHDYRDRPSAAELLTRPYFTADSLGPECESLESYSAALDEASSPTSESEESFVYTASVSASDIPQCNAAGMETVVSPPPVGPPPAATLPSTAPMTISRPPSDGWALPTRIVEFVDDTGSWARTARTIQTGILAYLDGLPDPNAPRGSIHLSAHGFRYLIDLDRMVQRNIASGRERSLRIRTGEIRDGARPMWLDEHGEWVPYPADVSRRILAAERQKERYVSYEVGPRRVYEIDVVALVQRNVSSNVYRIISLRAADRSPPTRILEFQGANGEWKRFDAAVARVVVRAFDKGHEEVILPAGSCTYLVDFRNWTQRNVATKFSRAVRLVPAPAPNTGAAPPAR